MEISRLIWVSPWICYLCWTRSISFNYSVGEKNASYFESRENFVSFLQSRKKSSWGKKPQQTQAFLFKCSWNKLIRNASILYLMSCKATFHLFKTTPPTNRKGKQEDWKPHKLLRWKTNQPYQGKLRPDNIGIWIFSFPTFLWYANLLLIKELWEEEDNSADHGDFGFWFLGLIPWWLG